VLKKEPPAFGNSRRSRRSYISSCRQSVPALHHRLFSTYQLNPEITSTVWCSIGLSRRRGGGRAARVQRTTSLIRLPANPERDLTNLLLRKHLHALRRFIRPDTLTPMKRTADEVRSFVQAFSRTYHRPLRCERTLAESDPLASPRTLWKYPKFFIRGNE